MNLADWARDALPNLTGVTELVYFDAEHPSGKEAVLRNEDHEARWRMEDGTVIDKSNNRNANVDIGLFSGQEGTIQVKALKPDKHFKVGDTAFLGIYYYRVTKDLDISQVFEFDPSLFTTQASTGKPIVVLEKNIVRGGGGVEALKITIPTAGPSIELPFRVKSDATKHFKKDGPGGSFGQFVLDFGSPDGVNDGPDNLGNRSVSWLERPEVTAGALLWK